MVDLVNGYSKNVDLVRGYHIAKDRVNNTATQLQRDVSLLRGCFGVDWRDKKPSELFELINEMWIYLFAMGEYDVTMLDNGDFTLNKKGL